MWFERGGEALRDEPKNGCDGHCCELYRSKIGHITIVSTDLSHIFSKHPVDLLLYVVVL